MADRNSITFPALKIVQPVGEFYVGVIRAQDLVAISVVDIRELENDLDTYMGIQRRLSPSRRKELSAYVNTYDATFPTSVLIAVREENATWNSDQSRMTLKASAKVPFEEIARIIDGQHRIDGLKAFEGDHFEINVAVFVGADVPLQANIFATVNLAQTKVNRSLVYDLLDYEKTRSPQKTAHHIAVALDSMEQSPLFHRIKRLGRATEGREEEEVLTQAAVVDCLLNHLTPDPMGDRDTFLRRLFVEKASPQELRRYFLRNLFLDKKDAEITKILLEYFDAVREKWPTSWDDFSREGNVLPKTNGFRALMRFLRPAYLAQSGGVVRGAIGKKKFAEVFSRVKLKDAAFNISTFPPGTSGESRLYNLLMEDAFGGEDPTKDMTIQ